MTDQTFLEILVARKRNMAAAALKIVCGVLAVFSLIIMLYSPLFLLAALVFAALAYFCHLQEWIEYEYTYVGRELSVDKIMARSRRKKAAEYQVDKMEIGAPEGSSHLDDYRNRDCALKDYSSKGGGKRFVIYYEGREKLILEADEKLLQALRSAAPSRIFLN